MVLYQVSERNVDDGRYGLFEVHTDDLTNVRWVGGTEGDDQIYGGQGDEWMAGFGGNDVISGREGIDRINGADGDDQLGGGAGADYIAGGAGTDMIDGSDGNDHLFGEDGDDWIVGGIGNDVLSGGAGENRLFGGTGIDTLVGGAQTDWMDGGSGADRLYGGYGDDFLRGGYNNDTLDGGDGVDRLNGGAQNDYLFGGDGNDYLDGGSGDDVLDGGGGDDRINGGSGNDVFVFGDGERFEHGNGMDIFDGGAGNRYSRLQHVSFDLGVDLSVGRAWTENESDKLINVENVSGTVYNDYIIGDAHANVLSGYYGNDTLWGGGGADTFRYDFVYQYYTLEHDTIRDFSSAEGDKIDLSVIDADSVRAGNQDFHFIGESDFTGSAGELRLVMPPDTAHSADYLQVEADANGDGIADLIIVVDGVEDAGMAATDFML